MAPRANSSSPASAWIHRPIHHAIVAWSSAAVIASEYPGILTQITAYGLATGVSVSRVLARQHFPSDVLVGSAVAG